MLQTHNKQHKVTYQNSYLELKVSGFFKSLFSRDFAELIHFVNLTNKVVRMLRGQNILRQNEGVSKA